MSKLLVLQDGKTTQIEFQGTPLLSDVLESHHFLLPHPCGKRGFCGKCAVRLTGTVSAPDKAEHRAGVRLSCRARLLGDAVVTLPDSTIMEQIELSIADPIPPAAGQLGAAVDIGTTTLAVRLYDLSTGICLADAGRLNPQTSFAADVMGRIDRALHGDLNAMREQVVLSIEEMLHELCSKAGKPKDMPEKMVVTGNTTMLYLLTGRDPVSLSHAPFQADFLFDETIELFGIPTYLPPCMNAFVGADITCATAYSGICRRQDTALLTDIGTNGEIVLWKEGRLYVSSTAAGPVFEGAGISCGSGSVRGAIDRVWLEGSTLCAHTIGDTKAESLCGSGLIDAAAAFLRLGLIDETGACEQNTLPLRDGVTLSSRDVRALQLGKAAIAAGIDTLLHQAAVSPGEITFLCIAGGFGSHLNAESAAAIGLWPRELTNRVNVLGNAALAGASRLLTDDAFREDLRRLTTNVTAVNLGGNPYFNERYVEQMFFPAEEYDLGT